MEFLINITIKSTVILLLSGSLLWLLKKASATLRHWIISLTMIGLLSLPILFGILPAITITIPYLPIKTGTVKTTIAKTAIIPKEIVQEAKLKSLEETITPTIKKSNKGQELVLENITNQGVTTPSTIIETNQSNAISINEIVLFVWLIGILFFTIKLLIGRYLIHKITIKMPTKG